MVTPTPSSSPGPKPEPAGTSVEPVTVKAPVVAVMPQADWRKLHLWDIQPVRDLLVLAGVVGVVYLGYLVRVVTVPMFLAILLAYLFEPLVRWLARRGISRAVSAIGIILVGAMVVVVPVSLGLGFGAVQGTRAASDLVANVQRVQKSLAAPEDESLRQAVPPGAWTRMRDFLSTKTQDTHSDEARALGRQAVDYLSTHAAEIGQQVGSRVLGGGAAAVGAAIGTVTSIVSVVVGGFLTAFFFYFFSTGWGRVLHFWEGLIPERRRHRAVEILSQMDRVIAGFVRGRLTICFILALYMILAYWIIGVPAPLLLGAVVGMLFIVPFVHVIGVPAAMLLLWLEAPATGIHAQWWWIVFAPIVVYLIAQGLDDWVLSPLIHGKNTNMDVPTILFASLAGGALAGIYGLLLAIPLAACVKILMREVFWPRFALWAKGKRPDFLPIERAGG